MRAGGVRRPGQFDQEQRVALGPSHQHLAVLRAQRLERELGQQVFGRGVVEGAEVDDTCAVVSSAHPGLSGRRVSTTSQGQTSACSAMRSTRLVEAWSRAWVSSNTKAAGPPTSVSVSSTKAPSSRRRRKRGSRSPTSRRRGERLRRTRRPGGVPTEAAPGALSSSVAISADGDLTAGDIVVQAEQLASGRPERPVRASAAEGVAGNAKGGKWPRLSGFSPRAGTCRYLPARPARLPCPVSPVRTLYRGGEQGSSAPPRRPTKAGCFDRGRGPGWRLPCRTS